MHRLMRLKNSNHLVIVDSEDYEELSKYSWRVLESGYIIRSSYKSERDSGMPKTIYMHRQIMNYPEGLQVDHINTHKFDNRKSNLRVVTNAQNHKNRPKKKNTTSKFKGVYQAKYNGKWIAKIVVDEIKIHLGSFDTEPDAAIAYDKAALKYFGEYARTNQMEGLLKINDSAGIL